MAAIKQHETTWEGDDGKETGLVANYTYYPPCKGGRNEYGVPVEPDWDAEIDILNIRTAHGQDPTLVIPEWDRDYAVEVIEARILEKLENEHG